jgi:hypothetical protein
MLPLQWGKKKKKLKKIHELQLRFSYRSFGMPAERTSFGALADITVTTSYPRNSAFEIAGQKGSSKTKRADKTG